MRKCCTAVMRCGWNHPGSMLCETSECFLDQEAMLLVVCLTRVATCKPPVSRTSAELTAPRGPRADCKATATWPWVEACSGYTTTMPHTWLPSR